MAKRGRKPSKERKGYFYEKEEEAFVNYLTASTQEEREKIFQECLHPAFTQMISSIIRRYNLYPPEETFEETFDDTISFLMSKVDKFDPSSGYKAYSYCGTICKNYLILKINKYKNEQKRYARYDAMQSELNNSLEHAYDQHNNKSEGLQELINSTCNEIESMMENAEKHKLTDREIRVGVALCEVLRNWEDLFSQMGSNKFNKSSILMFLKETTYLNTNEIRNSMKKYKTAYQIIRKKMVDDIYN